MAHQGPQGDHAPYGAQHDPTPQTEPLICRNYSPTWTSGNSINREQRPELFSLRAPLQYCCSLKRSILITSCLQDPLCFLELEPTFVSGPGAPVSHDFTCMCIYIPAEQPLQGIYPHWSLQKGSWWSRTAALCTHQLCNMKQK